jgi:hypothetical protein
MVLIKLLTRSSINECSAHKKNTISTPLQQIWMTVSGKKMGPKCWTSNNTEKIRLNSTPNSIFHPSSVEDSVAERQSMIIKHTVLN